MAQIGAASKRGGKARSLVPYPRSDPLKPASQHACQVCPKKFPTPRDLRRHEINHFRLFACNKCPAKWPSRKDLDRHISSRHQRKIRYHCTISECKESIFYMHVVDRGRRGFKRKDNWQRHMRVGHGMGEKELADIEKAGIPMANKVGTGWVEVSRPSANGQYLEEVCN
ncbi:hypothetical protein N431DRAFT_41367 [Stipitochalara longipes BDJ]|nr:hypothetical protein N431DRAFT_41367 [Stipitochalara longipes BDJ]